MHAARWLAILAGSINFKDGGWTSPGLSIYLAGYSEVRSGLGDVEQSIDTTQRIITLETEDGFKVRFTIPRNEQSLLGEALIQPMSEATVRPN